MSDWLFPSTDANTAQTLLLSGQWQDWVQALVILTSILIFALTIWNYRHTKRLSHKIGLLSLRAAILLLLLFLFYQPTLIQETIQRSRNTVVVLVDDSASMKLPHESGERIDEVTRFLERNAATFEEWQKTNDLLFYRFSDELAAMKDGADTASLTASGEKTAILENMQATLQQMGTRKLGGRHRSARSSRCWISKKSKPAWSATRWPC